MTLWAVSSSSDRRSRMSRHGRSSEWWLTPGIRQSGSETADGVPVLSAAARHEKCADIRNPHRRPTLGPGRGDARHRPRNRSELPMGIMSQSEQIGRSLQRERLFARLAQGILGCTAVMLSAIGIYGLLAYGVARRTREIGLRMALGAAQRTVRWMILRSRSCSSALGSCSDTGCPRGDEDPGVAALRARRA